MRPDMITFAALQISEDELEAGVAIVEHATVFFIKSLMIICICNNNKIGRAHV